MIVVLGYYIPRLAILVFVEIFAFFFLRLYKSGLQEMKYFQIELTNIKLKATAVEACLIQEHNNSMVDVIQQLIRKERNVAKSFAKVGESESNLNIQDLKSLIEAATKFSAKSQ